MTVLGDSSRQSAREHTRTKKNVGPPISILEFTITVGLRKAENNMVLQTVEVLRFPACFSIDCTCLERPRGNSRTYVADTNFSGGTGESGQAHV